MHVEIQCFSFFRLSYTKAKVWKCFIYPNFSYIPMFLLSKCFLYPSSTVLQLPTCLAVLTGCPPWMWLLMKLLMATHRLSVPGGSSCRAFTRHCTSSVLHSPPPASLKRNRKTSVTSLTLSNQTMELWMQILFWDKAPAMHRDIFRLLLANNRRLIENLHPWENAI